MNYQGFCQAVLDHGIGGYGLGVFRIKELENATGVRKEIVDLDMQKGRIQEVVRRIPMRRVLSGVTITEEGKTTRRIRKVERRS